MSAQLAVATFDYGEMAGTHPLIQSFGAAVLPSKSASHVRIVRTVGTYIRSACSPSTLTFFRDNAD